ncbi:hypothetical protein CYMTET_23421 [Cymbomonas tetramitiformis]|uniref:Uncharacterized protein n=1 Tax=Cymbomonas tetramitiformis TaxID=36881 RepID=A0AAE0FYI4_9CHLO|nr:hypothetical protein CYMTET_23421 [Cymbomonas tetramitiformis]
MADAKPHLHYYSDGGGRDSYISMSNGGMHKQPNFVTPDFKTPIHQTTNVSNMEVRPNHYRADGTGRDGYACVGSIDSYDFEKDLRSTRMQNETSQFNLGLGGGTSSRPRRVPSSRHFRSDVKLSVPKDLANVSPTRGRIASMNPSVEPNVRTGAATTYKGLMGTKSTFKTRSFSQSAQWI